MNTRGILLCYSVSNEMQEYFSSLHLWDNPVYLSLLLILLLLISLFLITRWIVIPLNRKFHIERQELREKTDCMMALFSELEPDPLIRINTSGKIIHFNSAAASFSEGLIKTGKNIQELFPGLAFDPEDFNAGDNLIRHYMDTGNKRYLIIMRRVQNEDLIHLYFRDITECRQYEQKMNDLTTLIQDKIEEERQRIARELHDSIGQNLSVIRFIIHRLFRVEESRPLHQEFDSILSLLERTINELKSIACGLKPVVLEEIGLNAALISLCNLTSAESGIKASCEISALRKRLPWKIEIAVYRVVQESVNNILKHSSASEFCIRLLPMGTFARLTITDNGTGFDISKVNSGERSVKNLGLLNMRQRIESFSGRFTVESVENQGTVIIIDIPVEEPIENEQNQTAYSR